MLLKPGDCPAFLLLAETRAPVGKATAGFSAALPFLDLLPAAPGRSPVHPMGRQGLASYQSMPLCA